MSTFFFEEFYHALQGVLLFQLLFFGFIFYINKRIEVVYYCLYLLCTLLYYFINGPKTFFNINDDLVFNSTWYVIVNYFLLISSIYFYVEFLAKIFDVQKNKLYKNLVHFTKLVLVCFFISFSIFPLLNLSRSLLFYMAHLTLLPLATYLLFTINTKEKYHNFIKYGIFFNLVGYLVSLLMIIRYNSGVRVYAIDEYPLIYMRIGTLVDIFFFQLAILIRLYEQEKRLAVKDLQSQVEVERLRNDISHEIHDDIGTTLSKINLTSYAASKKLESGEAIDVLQTLNGIQRASQEMITNLKDIVWSLEIDDYYYNDVFSKIQEYALSICPTKSIGTSFSFQHEAAQKVNLTVKYHLYLLCKEAINNAVKYSEASHLSINTQSGEDELLIVIKDNGIGFNTNHKTPGVGLKSMKSRADKMKANLVIQSSIDKGTDITITIKDLLK